MNQNTALTCLLETLSAIKEVIIRPFARKDFEVTYFAYYIEEAAQGQCAKHPVICSIEVNERTQQVEIKVGNDDTKVVGNGGILTGCNKMAISLSDDASKFLGVIIGDRLTDTSDLAKKAKEFKAVPEGFQQSATWAIQDTNKSTVAVMKSCPEASGVKVVFQEALTSNTRLMFMLYGLASIYQKYLFYTHPIPTNFFHLSSTSTAAPQNMGLRRRFTRLLLRPNFRDAHQSLFMDYMDAYTRNVQLIVECTFDAGNTIVFKDLCGTMQFTARTIKNDPKGLTVFSDTNELIGYCPPDVLLERYVDGPTDQTILYQNSKSADGLLKQVYPSTQAEVCVICEHSLLGESKTMSVNFIRDTSDRIKALILARVANAAMLEHKFADTLLPTVVYYPTKK